MVFSLLSPTARLVAARATAADAEEKAAAAAKIMLASGVDVVPPPRPGSEVKDEFWDWDIVATNQEDSEGVLILDDNLLKQLSQEERIEDDSREELRICPPPKQDTLLAPCFISEAEEAPAAEAHVWPPMETDSESSPAEGCVGKESASRRELQHADERALRLDPPHADVCLHEEETKDFFLPKTIHGVTVLVHEGGCQYRVDNSQLQATTFGISYRYTKDLSDKVNGKTAPWNCTIEGKDEGGNWVKVQLREKDLPKGEQYTCEKCGTPFFDHNDIESPNYYAMHGPGYLVQRASNLVFSLTTKRTQYTTGSYTVRDAYCKSCSAHLGVQYESAEDCRYSFKVGKFLFDRTMLHLPDGRSHPRDPPENN